MLNKLKIIFIAMTISTFAHAECKDDYKSAMIKESLIASATTGFGVYGAFAANAFIVIGMSFYAEYGIGAGISTAAIGGMAMGGAVTVVGSGVSTTVHGVSLLKSYKLIKQAEVGFGNALSNFTEDLSDELDREVTEDEVADIINLGNQSRDFCPDTSRTPYTKKEVFDYVKEIL